MRISYLISNKIVTDPKHVAFTDNYIQKDADIDELLKDLTSGHSIVPAQFKAGETKRKNENFESANLIMLDYDGGLSINKAKEIFKSEAVAIVPTRNHQKDKGGEVADRFRVILILPISVNANIHRIILKACVSIYGHDKKCTDQARGYITVQNGDIEILNKDNVFNLRRLLGIYFNDNNIRTKIYNDLNRNRSFFENIAEDIVTELKRLNLLDEDYKLPSIKGNFHKNLTNSIYNNIEYAKNSTYSLDSSSPSTPVEDELTKDMPEKRLIRNYDWEILNRKCEVFRDPKSSDHGELLILITNLSKIVGGLKRLKTILKDRPYNIVQRGDDYYETIRKSVDDYNPIGCSTFCSKYGTCGNSGNLLTFMEDENAKIKSIEENIELRTLEEARDELKRIWDKIHLDSSNNVHLIIAPTGIGKTHLLESLKEGKGTKVIASPRHDLIDKLQIGYTYPVINTKKYPDINELLDMGYRTNEFKDNDQLITNSESRVYLKEHFERLKQVSKEKIVKMTHEKLSYPKTFENVSNLECIYIDEDIMNTLYKIDSIENGNLERFIRHCRGLNTEPSNYISAYLQEWQNLEDGKVANVGGFDFTYLSNVSGYLKEINTERKSPLRKEKHEIMKAQGIYNLFYAEYALRVGENIYHIQKKILPKVKTIILSASPHLESYRKHFGDRLVIHNVGHVKPKGKCIMFPRFSFSKASLDDGRIEELRKLEKVLIDNSFEMISHLKTKIDIKLAAHYFATNGKRELEGKRLAVIGTPNPSEFYVKLKSAVLDLDPELVSGYQENNFMDVEYNGFKFNYKVLSKDPKIIDIQLHFIYNELLQAIGRARNLFKDVPVLLFSKFPIRFFEIRKKQGKYDLSSFVRETLGLEFMNNSEAEKVA